MAGALLTALGAALGRPELGFAALVFVSCVYAATHLRLIAVPFFSIPRQVPVSWRASTHQYRVLLAYGFLLGAGIFTHIKSGTFYAFLSLVFLVIGQPLLGGLVMACYGVARASAMVSYTLMAPGLKPAYKLHNRLVHARRLWERTSALVLIAVAIYGSSFLI